jgi:hypothetical protein
MAVLLINNDVGGSDCGRWVGKSMEIADELWQRKIYICCLRRSDIFYCSSDVIRIVSG